MHANIYLPKEHEIEVRIVISKLSERHHDDRIHNMAKMMLECQLSIRISKDLARFISSLKEHDGDIRIPIFQLCDGLTRHCDVSDIIK